MNIVSSRGLAVSCDQPFYVVVAPSGAGKSSLIYGLLEKYSHVAELSVSYTTRASRKGEEEGVHYYFTDSDQFKQLMAQNKLLEWAKVHECYYGTAISEIERIQSTGKKAILEVDIQGLEQLIQLPAVQVRSLFICPPSIAEMANRLKRRGTTEVKDLSVRFASAKRELSKAHLCNYFLVNHSFEGSLEILTSWILHDKPPTLSKDVALGLVKSCLAELDQIELLRSQPEMKYG